MLLFNEFCMIEIVKILLPILSILFSFWVYRENRNTGKINNLFSLFAKANDITLKDVNLLMSVHGINTLDSYLNNIKNEDEREREVQSIIYLSILLDGLQQEYIGSNYRNSKFNIKGEEKIYNKMKDNLKNSTNFFTNIFRVHKNKNRWEICKKIYYGESDKYFIEAIDDLFNHFIK